ncbi:MAG: carbohydrate-binding family 9-like protein [Acidobacteriaceae bacterium]|nr:carbohydrate-binding family 9-like protein [Acidobacteriaceae bacterium]
MTLNPLWGVFVSALLLTPHLDAQTPCVVAESRASFTVRHVEGEPALNLDPEANVWKDAAPQSMSKDCSRQIDYPNIRTEIRGFWTDTDLYLLFRCPYSVLNTFPADNSKAHVGLWDRDVVEMFLGDDWTNIRHYREFEIAPTGDWIDLAIDLDRQSYDHNWRSGWQTMARIDESNHVWYAAAKIPLAAVSAAPVRDGTKWRANLYRIDGLGADPQRHFLCWQPTCVQNRDPNHVPEHFGTLIFSK